MSAARYFRWLPNALTLSRSALGVFALAATINGDWALAFWLLFGAFTTDFLDGLAARKLHAQTNYGVYLDKYTDLALSGLGMLGLALAGHMSWWVIAVAPLISGFLAYERFFILRGKRLHQIRPFLSVCYMLVVWVGLAWAYLSLAYGWSWGYVPLTFGLLTLSGLLKRHRLRAWMGLAPERGERPAK